MSNFKKVTIMKTIVSNELKSRLTHAAENGSRIASDILAELKSGKNVSEVIRGSANYFSTKRKKSSNEIFISMKIVFTACTKDISNENFPDRQNPQAPWFPENRTDLEPSTFISYFKNLPEYSNYEIDYFNSAICINSKVTFKLYDTMNDIIEAYKSENYSPIVQYGETTLHNSCMRYEESSRNAADFYHNFAGAKIIVAKDSSNYVLARAIVWPKVIWKKDDHEEIISVLDRIYFTHTFVLQKIYEYAAGVGIHLRKRINDYEHTKSFITLNTIDAYSIIKDSHIDDLHLKIKVPASKWHKRGVPYLDTFCELHITENNEFELRNYSDYKYHLASCRSTDGSANRVKYLCPCCGKLHNDNTAPICNNCNDRIFKKTVFGDAIEGKPVKYKGETYPSLLFRKGHPNPNLKLYLSLERIF